MDVQARNLTHRKKTSHGKKLVGTLDGYCQRLLLALGHLRHPYALLGFGLLFALLGLRFRGDEMFASPFLRAFVGRGVVAAAGFGLTAAIAVSLVLAAHRWLRERVPPWDLAGAGQLAAKAVPALLVGALVGFAANVGFTLTLASLYDEEIMARAEAVDRLDRFVTLRYPGDPQPPTLRRRADGSYVHRLASLERVTETAKGVLLVGEDRRQPYRVDGWDVIGRLRSLAANAKRALTGRGSAQGGSPISEQLGGMLFDIRPNREPTLAARLSAKAVKFLIGTRLDDLYSREDQVRRYLSRVSFGSYRGHEVEGLRAAALAFYGVEPERLTPAQLADLIARVQLPAVYFPYPRPGESPEDFAARHKRHRERAEWILEMGRQEGVLTPEEEQQAHRELFTGLRPAEELRNHLSRPGLFTVFRELERRAPGAVRHLDVVVGLDARAQQALDAAVGEARRGLDAVAGRRAGDEVVVDAVVLGEYGAIRARAGMYATPGDGASQYKGEIYAEALAHGLIRSMSDEVLPGMNASVALYTSNNDAAEDLARKVGLELYRAHLEGQGLRVTGPFPSIALGAGVDGSPLTAAVMFNKFGYRSPGSIFEDPSLLAEVREAGNGKPVFAPRRRQLYQPAVCEEVRKALEACALKGTARVLAPLARAGALSAKTGTAAFMKDGVLTGNGGSWTLVNDGPSRSTVAVRVRWRSGRPFAPNGGRSAALVALHLLPRLRAIN